MIKRYSCNRMLQLWSDKTKYDAWLRVELAVCDIYHRQGLILDQEKTALDKATFSINRIKQLELETKHDVVSFTRAVSETLKAEKRWIHYGLTSSDVVDTATGLILKQVNIILLKDILDLRKV
ncbi:MAG: lyase family protein, partial [Erysipelotrichaceae bacterium]